jgi:peptidoglycan hydrolase CwlO-like protein
MLCYATPLCCATCGVTRPEQECQTKFSRGWRDGQRNGAILLGLQILPEFRHQSEPSVQRGNKQMTKINNKVDENTKEIKSMNMRVDGAEETIAKLTKKVNKMEKKIGEEFYGEIRERDSSMEK